MRRLKYEVVSHIPNTHMVVAKDCPLPMLKHSAYRGARPYDCLNCEYCSEAPTRTEGGSGRVACEHPDFTPVS